MAATFRAALHICMGQFGAAAALIDEAATIAQATGMAPLKYGSLMVAAWRGDDAAGFELIEAGRRAAVGSGDGMGLAAIEWAAALLYNSRGRYPEALACAQTACEHDDVVVFAWGLVELIEAGVRSGATDTTSSALERLSERTQASGTDWALGMEAYARALLADARDAEALYREAVERLERCRVVVHLARARLVYGEWLRREGRRADAREHLRAAHDAFGRFGAQAFAERARRELLATGETVRAHAVDSREALTAQEAQMARLAQEGRTNPEIGAELFISPRTVEYHLRKVFLKLDISSRKELRAALANAGESAAFV